MQIITESSAVESPSSLDKSDAEKVPTPAGRLRWTMCALVFAATTINYIDRGMISVLKPTLTKIFGWTQIDYGNIVLCFAAAYAIGQLGAGYLLDRVGVRRGFAIAVALWSLAAMAHGFVAYVPAHQATGFAFLSTTSVLAFAFVRVLLGLSEAMNFPAGIKTIALWFPQRDRAGATGVMNAGSNVGALVTPLLAPVLTLSFGWAAAFYVTGALGSLWLVAWLLLYYDPDKHPSLTREEYDYIHRDPIGIVAKIPYKLVIAQRQTWAFAIGKFLTDPVWWFYLFWVPDFLHARYNMDLKSFGPPLVVIYLMADFGSVLGGWLSCFLIARGWTVNAGRKTAMLVCALCVVPIFAATHVTNVWTAVLLIGLAASAHQGWSSNLFTLTSDTAPRGAVGSVMGFGGMAGALGGMLFAPFVGHILDATHNNYVIPFTLAAGAYLVALLIIQCLMPRLDPMRFPGIAAGDEYSTENCR